MDTPKFTEPVARALEHALELAKQKNHTQLTEDHLLYSLLQEEGGYFQTFAKKKKLDSKELSHALKKNSSLCPLL